jgi:competence protein ComEC
LLISHSHHDHIGGAVSVLGEYQDRIEKICFVQDDLFLDSSFWRRVSELLRAGTLTKDRLIRLEATGEPQLVWSGQVHGAQLRTYSPTAAENLLAQEAGVQNPTSAVLFLDASNDRIVFAADSEVDQWRQIRQKSGQQISCKVLAVPHHAGRAHSSPDDLAWLFNEAISAAIAVISVGTSNTHGHPRQDVVEALSNRGTSVLCTQITRRCSDALERLRPGVLRPVLYPGRSSPDRDLTGAGNSRNVGCAGTVRAIVSDSGIIVDRLEDHQRDVDALAIASSVCPLCRRVSDASDLRTPTC